MRRLMVVLLAALLAACAPQAPVPQATAISAVPSGFPLGHYGELLRRGGEVFRVLPDESLLVVEVRRAGSLARLGHDHVVASRHVHGYVAPGEGRGDLFVPLERMTVDQAALRAESGMAAGPTAADIEGTRRNMLAVLDVARHPDVLLSVKSWAGGQAQLELTLHGVTRGMIVPVTIETGPDALTASGRFSINQTDFGIKPFSILGGAIQVQDRLDLRFRLVAKVVRNAGEL
jgi:hypothetical protein